MSVTVAQIFPKEMTDWHMSSRFAGSLLMFAPLLCIFYRPKMWRQAKKSFYGRRMNECYTSSNNSDLPPCLHQFQLSIRRSQESLSTLHVSSAHAQMPQDFQITHHPLICLSLSPMNDLQCTRLPCAAWSNTRTCHRHVINMYAWELPTHLLLSSFP